jgi:hypothetical protein
MKSTYNLEKQYQACQDTEEQCLVCGDSYTPGILYDDEAGYYNDPGDETCGECRESEKRQDE